MKSIFLKRLVLSSGVFTAMPTALALLFAGMLPAKIFAQAPTISYSSPQTYYQGVTINQLEPTSTNVGGNAYAGPIVAIGSGFSGPTGTAVDAAGNVYVADYGNKLVKKIPVGGGSPVAVGSGFNAPIAVALDAAGNLFVADYGNHAVYKVAAGGGSTQEISSAFSQPVGIAVDGSDDIFVADAGNNEVYELYGSGGQATIGSGFSHPSGVAVDGSGNVYIADTGNRDLKEVPVGTNVPYAVTGTNYAPYGVAVDAIGDVFFSGTGAGSVEEYLLSGQVVAFGTGLNDPAGISVDVTGKVYVADQGNNAVKELIPGGGYYINKALPQGLYFDTSTGNISRTPTVVSGATNYTVTTYNSSGVSASATVNITVLSNNANLSALQISEGTLTPVFATSTTTYAAAVDNNITSITVTPTAASTGATISVNSTSVTSGTPSGAIPLSVGTNTITVLVTASGGGSTNTYTITVTRAQSANNNLANLVVSNGTLSPAFGTATSYQDNVGNGSHFTITPTVADATATLTINGTAASSGSATAVALTAGSNTVSIVVTAQNSTTKTYTVTVNEARSSNNTLFSLKTSGGLAKGEVVPLTLTESVPNLTSGITVTPTMADNTATVTVNGTAVTSGTASASIPLSVGANTITIIGTAQNGSTLTYTLTVTRAANANLSNLSLSAGSLSPAFATATATYDAAVGNSAATIMVTPTAVDPNATIKINGSTVASGSASQAITLSVGNNTITIAVTAADNSSTNTYTVKVNRALSSDDVLFSIKTSQGLAIGKTVPTTLTENVSSGTSGIRVTPTVDDPTATVTVNSAAVTSGTQSASIPLAVGQTNITVIVTAQNGATQTYTLTVTRAMAGANSVYEPVSVGVQNFEPLLSDDGINVHQGISPNGDGINDYLQIDNITNYPQNNLKIMNRNGQLIYEAKGYDNAAKAFDGHSNKNGQMQLPGTYFYELDYVVNGITKQKTGYLVLKY